MSKICSGGWQAGGPGELMVQMKPHGSLACRSHFVLFKSSPHGMRLIHIMEGNQLYAKFTNLNINLTQQHPPSGHIELIITDV